jgi:GNAT superfamily N-acetyltransferase
MVQGSGEAAGICGWMPARADPEPPEPIPGLAHLWLLFVMPEHWGSRLASDLLAWAQAGMIDASYDAARLWTPVGQNRARAFYERRRWRPTGRKQFSDDLGLQLVEYRVELG